MRRVDLTDDERAAVLVALRRYIRHLETNRRKCKDDAKSREKYAAKIVGAMAAHNKTFMAKTPVEEIIAKTKGIRL